MKQERLRTRILRCSDEIKFVARSEQYGVAEFVFCLLYLRGKLRRVFIAPAQQADVKETFEIDASYGPSDFCLGAYTHKGMGEPKAWLYFWCAEHKASAFRVYVPAEATKFRVFTGSSVSITFDTD